MITVTSNLKGLEKTTREYLQRRATALLRTTGRDELKGFRRVHGKGSRIFVTVDRTPRRQIESANRIIEMTLAENQKLSIAAILAKIQALVYSITVTKLGRSGKLTRRTGRLGIWTYDQQRRGRPLPRSNHPVIDVSPGDSVRLRPTAAYASPLSSLLSKNRFVKYLSTKSGKKKLQGDVFVTRSNPLKSRGISSILARTLQKDGLLLGFRIVGRFVRKAASNRIRTSLALDVTTKKLGRK